MPVPKRKRSRARRDKRFANKGIAVKVFTECQSCHAVCMPHQVCRACGYYKGVKVLNTKAERALKRGETRKQKKAREKQQTVEEKE